MNIEHKYKGLKLYNLEKEIGDFEEAVKIRRKIIETKWKKPVLKNLPFKFFPYSFTCSIQYVRFIGNKGK